MQDHEEHKKLKTKFGTNIKEDLIEFITHYQNRKFAEDVEYLESKEGDIWIEKGLYTDFKNGLTGADQSEREAHFGSNRKIPPP